MSYTKTDEGGRGWGEDGSHSPVTDFVSSPDDYAPHVEGDRFIISDPAASTPFFGHNDEIASHIPSLTPPWKFTVPSIGDSVYIIEQERTYTFTGTYWFVVVDGTDGYDGADGADGADGYDGADGADGADGYDGADGADGADGGSVSSSTVSLTPSGGILSWDTASGSMAKTAFISNTTIAAPTNLSSGATYILIIEQASGSSSNVNIIWDSIFSFPNDVPLAAISASTTSIISFISYDGLKLYSVSQDNF
jgi:hypothetical protein